MLYAYRDFIYFFCGLFAFDYHTGTRFIVCGFSEHCQREKIWNRRHVGTAGRLSFHLTLFAFGVSALISRSTYLFQTVKIAGALYLFWLAYNVFKSDNVIVIDQGVGGSGSFLGFMRKGLFMNILNPKVMMFFLAFFPGFISEEAGSVTRQVWILGMIFVTQTLVVFSTISIIASQLTDVIKNNTTVHTFLKWMQIVVFTLLGIYILW